MSLNGYSWVEGRVPNAVDPSGNCVEDRICRMLRITNPRAYREVCSLYRGVNDNCYAGLESMPPEETFLFPHTLPPSTKPEMGDYAIWRWSKLPLTIIYTLLYETALSVGAGVLDALGYNLAAENMYHYLEGSGEPRIIDIDQMLIDVPEAQVEIHSKFFTDVMPLLGRQIEQTTSAQGACEYFQFTPAHDQFGGWFVSTIFGQGSSTDGVIRDYYLGIGEFNYGFSGIVSLSSLDDSLIQVDLCWLVNFFDRYDWSPGFGANLGPIFIPDEDPGRLHLFGSAQEFEVYGVSSYNCSTAYISRQRI